MYIERRRKNKKVTRQKPFSTLNMRIFDLQLIDIYVYIHLIVTCIRTAETLGGYWRLYWTE